MDTPHDNNAFYSVLLLPSSPGGLPFGLPCLN
nr:hypothetical protein [Human alphaherpesvirus 2]